MGQIWLPASLQFHSLSQHREIKAAPGEEVIRIPARAQRNQ